jgi:hypothetical protein
MQEVKWATTLSIVLLIVTLFGYAIAPVFATSGSGSFTLIMSGYPVNGNLQNVVANSDGSVSMNMVLDGSVSSPIGPVPIVANGAWVGMRNGSELSGMIQNVAGTARICFIFWCGNANFVGQGEWSGTLASNSTLGSGGFEGTITFTSSDFSQIPVGQPQPVSGTWNADFS